MSEKMGKEQWKIINVRETKRLLPSYAVPHKHSMWEGDAF